MCEKCPKQISKTLTNYFFNDIYIGDDELGHYIIQQRGIKIIYEDKTTKTAKLYHKTNWQNTNEELFRESQKQNKTKQRRNFASHHKTNKRKTQS